MVDLLSGRHHFIQPYYPPLRNEGGRHRVPKTRWRVFAKGCFDSGGTRFDAAARTVASPSSEWSASPKGGSGRSNRSSMAATTLTTPGFMSGRTGDARAHALDLPQVDEVMPRGERCLMPDRLASPLGVEAGVLPLLGREAGEET